MGGGPQLVGAAATVIASILAEFAAHQYKRLGAATHLHPRFTQG
jgi:hypothetical protein